MSINANSSEILTITVTTSSFIPQDQYTTQAMEDISKFKGFVRSLEASIDDLTEALEPVLDTPLDDIIAECTTAQQKAKAYNSYLYCVISILFAYIKSLGVNTDSHPIMKELTKIKQSMKALKDAEEALKKKNEITKSEKDKTEEFLQRALGTTGGAAAPESMKSPAISKVNFEGKHTKFENDTTDAPVAKSIKKPSGKVTKPKKGSKRSSK